MTSEQTWPQWSGNVTRTERTRILRKTLELKFKGNKRMDDLEYDGSARYRQVLRTQEIASGK
jgi:hypothetical protein